MTASRAKQIEAANQMYAEHVKQHLIRSMKGPATMPSPTTAVLLMYSAENKWGYVLHVNKMQIDTADTKQQMCSKLAAGYAPGTKINIIHALVLPVTEHKFADPQPR